MMRIWKKVKAVQQLNPLGYKMCTILNIAKEETAGPLSPALRFFSGEVLFKRCCMMSSSFGQVINL